MNSRNEGDLVYIPSSVRMEAEVQNDIPKKIYVTEQPLHYLVVESIDKKWIRVLHEGSTWRVKHSDVYEVST